MTKNIMNYLPITAKRGLPTPASRKGVKTMEALFDVLLYVVIIGGMAFIIGGLICGIHTMRAKIRCANIKLLWQVHRRHRRV